ncbi:patatin-like phospholipase family protein [Caproiciproducens galactitolivorans]|uniref:Patatin family protein n=1 Tax=Caproiciproducens galactitolivorans TaxID=642589 RepID=A0ABT4BU15_9FIRM|nr:patatin family protein [Caproiciproducens galactitolivorans]MCY1714391.1 patatin family protein [Caproiciproducens galactitolivorans]
MKCEVFVVPIGLVLEGGGMRGAYTSGVLEVLLEENIEFPIVYGISAGACNALSYISKQKNRNYDIFYKYITDKRYISVENLNQYGSLFGFDFIFGELFHKLLPFDYKTFFDSPVELKVGTTDLKTGQAVYFDKANLDEDFTAVKASSSLPFISNIVSYQGYELLDGGCAAPIPIERSIFDGNERNVIVLTRDSTYRKSLRPEFPRAVLRVKYGDYPNFVNTMMRRAEVYNNELEVCRRQESEGKAVIIRPSRPIEAGRYEKNPAVLKSIYEMGMNDCKNKLKELRAFMG